MDALEPGTRIVFTQSIFEDACGDHPEFILAAAGDGGAIVRKSDLEWFDYVVTWDGFDKGFHARTTEFALAT